MTLLQTNNELTFYIIVVHNHQKYNLLLSKTATSRLHKLKDDQVKFYYTTIIKYTKIK